MTLLVGFTFNGESKPYVTALRKTRPYWAARTRNIRKVPGRAGGRLVSTEIEPLIIPVRIMVEGITRIDYRSKAEEVAAWLDTEQPAALRFNDDPYRTYYAVVQGELDPEEIVSFGFVDIEFICPDPYKYSLNKGESFVDGTAIINNGGNAPAEPVFEFEVLDSITHLDVFTDKGYMRIGEPHDIDKTPVKAEERVLWDELGSLVSWAVSGGTENGKVTGNIISNGYALIQENFGTDPHWHGPAVQRSIPQAPIKDFKVEVLIHFLTPSAAHIGRIVIELLNETGNIIARMNMNKRAQTVRGNEAVVRAGNLTNHQFLINQVSPHWQQFRGMLRITRRGDLWSGYIAQVDDFNRTAVHHTRSYKEHLDVSKTLNRGDLAQIRVHFGKYGDKSTPAMAVHDLKVFRYNEVAANEVQYIAHSGDIITIDHKDSVILINGESRTDLKDFGASYFDLEKGDNVISVAPADKLRGTVQFRERY